MKKICILGSDGVSGGVSNYIVNLVNFTNSSVKYFILSKNFKFFKKNIKKKFKFKNYNINFNIFNICFRIYSLKKLVQINKIKIIHTHTQRAAFLVCLLKFFFMKQIKIIYTPHGFRHLQLKNFRKIFHLLIEKFILFNINHIILITKKEESYINSITFNYFKSTFIKTSIPKIQFNEKISLKKKFNINRKNRIVLMCGSVQNIKQPELFVEIATKIINEIDDVYFIWIGENLNKFNKFKNDKIKFVGNIESKLKYYSYMRSADIFLMTSKLETYPITVLEARRVGLPIVCNNFDGLKDILHKSNFEKKFKYNNSDNAVKILKKLLSKKNPIIRKNKIVNSDKFIFELCQKHVYIYNRLK